MTRDELLKNHETICQEARNLMELKNKDYAGNGGLEPFANFTRCEAMGVCTTEQGFLFRIGMKFANGKERLAVQDIFRAYIRCHLQKGTQSRVQVFYFSQTNINRDRYGFDSHLY